MKESMSHALEIGSLALWTSVTGLAAISICSPTKLPQMAKADRGRIGEISIEVSTGNSKEFRTGEVEAPEVPPQATPHPGEPLPAPPAMSRPLEFFPLPVVPPLPMPATPSAGMSLAARIAVAHTPGPSYPAYSKQSGQTGTVVVQFTVTTRGQVIDVSIYTSSNWILLDQEALRTVATWKFPAGETMVLVRPIVFQLP